MRSSRPLLCSALLLLASPLLQHTYAAPGDTPQQTAPTTPAARAELAERRILTSPKDAAAWQDLIRARLEMNDSVRAQNAFERWSATASGKRSRTPEMLLIEGEIALAAGDPEKAVACWKSYPASGPQKARAWRLTANAFASQKNWKEAVSALTETLALQKPTPNTAVEDLVQRAQWLIQLRDWPHAAADIEAANALKATHAQVKVLLPVFEKRAAWMPLMEALDQAVRDAADSRTKADVLIKRSRLFLELPLPAAALEDALEAHATAPEMPRTRLWKGLCKATCDPEADTAPVRNPNSNYLAWILHPDQQGKLDALDSLNDPEQQAEVLLQLRQPEMAWLIVQNLDGSIAKVKALRQMNDEFRTRRAAQRAAQLHPQSAEALLLLAEVELENGNQAESIHLAEKVLTMADPRARDRATNLRNNALAVKGTR